MNQQAAPQSNAPQSRGLPRLINLATAFILVAGSIFLINREGSLLPTPEPEAATTPQPQALYQLGEEVYTFEKLTAEFQQPLYEIQKLAFEQQLLVLEQAIVESHIAAQMQSLQQSREAVLERLLPGAAPSEEEIKRFYHDNRRADTPPLEKMREGIARHLLEANRDALKRKLLADLLIRGEARFLVETPQRPASTPD